MGAAQGILCRAWALLRRVSGDDAYERYAAHVRRKHPGRMPLSPREFEDQRLRHKWDRISRCC